MMVGHRKPGIIQHIVSISSLRNGAVDREPYEIFIYIIAIADSKLNRL